MSKLNDKDGVYVQHTSLGNIAITMPLDYLDDPMFPRGNRTSDLTLVLGRADAEDLGRRLIAAARKRI